MNAYKSVISFCLLLVAIRRGSCAYTPLDEKAKCVNSKLVQYANYYACICEEGKVHSDDLNCSEPIKSKCSKADEICGDYAKCVEKGVDPDKTFQCECLTGYELSAGATPVCVPKGCKAIADTCGKGKCSKKDDTNPICACHVGNKLDSSSVKCVVDETNTIECKLTCPGEHAGCVATTDGYLDCGCEDGYEMKEGKCVAEPVVDKYTPLNETAKCENSTLVQYSNYYACICESGKVHSSDLKCVGPINGECSKAGDICGEYANCVSEGTAPDVKHICKCMEGYEYNDAKPPVCVPLGCNGLLDNCSGSSCIKKDSLTAQCGCFLSTKFDSASGKCIADTEAPACKLTCAGENTGCVVEDTVYYKCGCKENFELKEGKCVEKPKNPNSAFPASGILNVGLLFIASSIIYVLV